MQDLNIASFLKAQHGDNLCLYPVKVGDATEADPAIADMVAILTILWMFQLTLALLACSMNSLRFSIPGRIRISIYTRWQYATEGSEDIRW